MIEIDLLKKHGKKALGMAEHAPHQQTWRQRLPEILLEIGIIVFAITLSIQLHAWHERSLSRTEEREFLTGLKGDLQADLRELHSDSLSYVRKGEIFQTLATLPPAGSAQQASALGKQVFYTTIYLIPNDSRYEGFKSAGKLDLVEDNQLLNNILDLYQEKIPQLLTITRNYNGFITDQLQPYLNEHLDATDGNVLPLLATNRMKRYLHQGQQTGEAVGQYHVVLQQSRTIIREIDQHLGQE